MAARVVTFLSQAVGERLDKIIAGEIRDISRTQAQRLIVEGFVTLNGQIVVKAAFKLEAPGSIRVEIPPSAPAAHAPEPIPLDIVYEDDDLLVVNKPAGMVVHPSAGHAQGTLVNAVLAHDPSLAGVGDAQRPGIVHRLDKDTSGLIVVAKHDPAHRELQRQFKERTVEKTYLALVDGRPPTPTGRVEAAIGRDLKQRKRLAVVPEPLGRLAITEYATRETFVAHALLEARLLTGRTHQLRLHFAYLGCPIVGDRLYGLRRPSLPLDRQFLHAARLRLRLPHAGQPMAFEAPLPSELARVLDMLRG